MVAISLYKGNLHRTPDTPRQWLMPARKISLKDFKILSNRRSRALARLQSTSNPNPNPNPNSGAQQPQSNGSLEVIINDSSLLKLNGDKIVDILPNLNGVENGKKGSTGYEDDNGDDNLVIPIGEVVADVNAVFLENGSVEMQEDQLVPPKDDSLVDKKERKKVVEEKLQVLNERKHKLVQVLKQILHAEEELRRRSNLQGVTGRPSISLQVDIPNDYVLLSTHVTPRPGSEVADMEGADADDVSNQNMHSRNMTRMRSMSPTSDSLHRRGPFSMVPNPSRGVAASSPSRFAPSCNGQQQGNLPTISVIGTNYVLSSPSPAGSGGTSVFRDARLPSPWN